MRTDRVVNGQRYPGLAYYDMMCTTCTMFIINCLIYSMATHIILHDFLSYLYHPWNLQEQYQFPSFSMSYPGSDAIISNLISLYSAQFGPAVIYNTL